MESHEETLNLEAMESQAVESTLSMDSHEPSTVTVVPNVDEPKAENGLEGAKEGIPLSKRAAKKLVRHQKWLENRPFRK
jgi:hypothetical protein